ncbi:hypothetical protein KDA_68080 [Dictyobacter alpinus]|uniref:Uncharacterized protein n=1 Tax=Dictyobacter alpinus TaxID=2014873 RepID=A0A402BIU9_9CHLR|nr:hypothetical protein KDA_68080 [Dictyobacter alpinus]
MLVMYNAENIAFVSLYNDECGARFTRSHFLGMRMINIFIAQCNINDEHKVLE